MTETHMRNLITDVPGLRIGNLHDEALASGVTVLMAESAFTAAATVIGGGPGTRELDALGLEGTVGSADAIVLAGGSAFGVGSTFLFHAFGMAIFCAALFVMRLPKREVSLRSRGSLLNDVIDSFRYVRHHVGIRSLFAMLAMGCVFLRPKGDALFVIDAVSFEPPKAS